MQTTDQKKKVGIVIQARLGSTRLPGKVTRPLFNKETLISVLVSNLRESQFVDKENIILAISERITDNKLEQYSRDKGFTFFRGSEDNVLERIIKATEGKGLDYIVRVCSNNLFTDCSLMDHAISQAIADPEIDYLSYSIHNSPAMLTQYGFFSEVIRYETLNRFYNEVASTKDDFEQVTQGIYTRPDEFNSAFVDLSVFFNKETPVRTTIDTTEDFQIINNLYKELSRKKKQINFIDVLNYIRNNEEITASMEKLIQGSRE